HDSSAAEAAARASRERLGMLAHELRNYLHTATLALSAIRADDVGPAAGTLGVLDRSLLAMTKLINRSLGEVRARAAFPVRHMAIDVGSFIEDVQAAASLEAAVSECPLNVSPVDPMLAVWGDHALLWSAVGN